MCDLARYVCRKLYNSASIDEAFTASINQDFFGSLGQNSILNFLSTVTSTPLEYHQSFGDIRYFCHVVNASNLNEAPFQLIIAKASQGHSCALLIGSTLYYLVSVSSKWTGVDTHWVENPAIRHLSIQANKMIQKLCQTGIIFDQIDTHCSVRALAAITRNPGHQLLNEVAPSIYLLAKKNIHQLYVGPDDYYGLTRIADTLNLRATYQLNIDNLNVEVFASCVRIFGYNSKFARIPNLKLPINGRLFSFLESDYAADRICKQLSEANLLCIYLSLRSDRKRKLVADPFQTFSDAIEKILKYYDSGTPSNEYPRLTILIDSISMPCQKSSFNTNPRSIKRELRFATLMTKYLSHKYPKALKIHNISGLSFLQKMYVKSRHPMIFMGYAGAGYCIFNNYSGLDSPALLLGDDHIFDIYCSSRCHEQFGRSLANSYFVPLATSHNCIWEPTKDPFPFAFFECIPDRFDKRCSQFAADASEFLRSVAPLTTRQ